MNELSKFKDWFFLDDAAKELSRALGNQWTSRDALQAVFDGHFSLSWNVMGKGVLPAYVPLPEFGQPIPDQSLMVIIKGQYKIVFDDNKNNLQGVLAIREKWLNSLIKASSSEKNITNHIDFLIEDSKGNFWRPMKFEAKGSIASASFGPNIGNERIQSNPEGFYPQLDMPDVSELIIRKVDLELFLATASISTNPNGIQKKREKIIEEYLTNNELSRIKTLTLQQVWSELGKIDPKSFKVSSSRTIGDCFTQCRKVGIPFPMLKKPQK